MGLKSIERDDLVAGHVITSTQLMPRRAFRLAAKIAKYVAPAFASAGKISMESDLKELMPAIIAMLSGLDEKDLDVALTEILSGTVVVRTHAEDGGRPEKFDLSNPAKIDACFMDSGLPAMMAVSRLALEVNFGDFFDASAKPPEAAGTPAASE